MPAREGDGLVELGMLVTVEGRPNLVVGAPAAFACVASFASLRLNGSFDELQGTAPKGIDLDPYSVAVLAAPVREVQVLSAKALDKREQIEQNCGPGWPPPRWSPCLSRLNF